MKKATIIFSMIALVAAGCSTSKNATEKLQSEKASDSTEVVESNRFHGPGQMDTTPEEVEKYRYHFFDGYQPSRTRKFDLLHTELHVSFDWEKEHLLGKARLTLTPYFYPQKALVLDAKFYDIHEVALLDDAEEKRPLKFDYDSLQLTIRLPRTYRKGEKLEVFIHYTAKPNESSATGSSAIAKGQGLYFVNADGKQKDKPRQIWTQGEPVANSHWFPTIDAPNERTTQDIYITVNDTLTTLSNGALISRQRNDDGTRTDHWQMEQPHAPYLFMMAVGNWVVTEDEWNGIPVNYYLEPKYAPYAKDIFGNTPEMLEYYSNVLGVKYPWPKYSQVVVRDFVSGAMENTTATIHYSALNSTHQELIDNNHEDIIAHELFHHWFGDLVTCESWANIPLNESFATYGEILWAEHKHGLDGADEARQNDIDLYMMMARQNMVPMIRYYHGKPDAMFDANSYQRGGATLAMLREYLGDDAFFAALKYYLDEHQYQSVEIHDLRLAFEKVTGEDLNWFFDQWFMTAGYPKVDMAVRKDSSGANYLLTVSQEHAYNEEFIYRLPITIHLYQKGKKNEQRIWLTSADSTYYFSNIFDLVIPDPGNMLVGKVTKSYPRGFYKKILARNCRLKERSVALDSVALYQQEDLQAYTAIRSALDDPYHRVRVNALNVWEPRDEHFPIIREMALADPHSSVRAAAVNKIYSVRDTADYDVFYTAIEDSSMRVASAALYLINETAPEKSMVYASRFENSNNASLLTTLAEIYADDAGPGKLSFFIKSVRKDISWARFIIMNRFAEFLGRMEDEQTIRKGVNSMVEMAKTGNHTEAYVAFRGIKRVKGDLEERTQMMNSKEEETMLKELINELDKILKDIYENSDNDMIQTSGLD